MAIVTPPKRTLVEAQQVVRHPLERVRGTIRTYVALEGTALLLILLALWFWVTFVLDFAPFRLFGWDWVQVEEISRPVRALSLGCLFLCAVALMRAGLIGRVFGPEARLISRTAFASTDKRRSSKIAFGTMVKLLLCRRRMMVMRPAPHCSKQQPNQPWGDSCATIAHPLRL